MTAGQSPLRVCIGVPTFRRPRLLVSLLEALVPELAGLSATILVADNDVSEEVRTAVRELGLRVLVPIFYIPVAQRGISHARNALVAGAFVRASDFEWLVMYDDDAMIRPGALRRLLDGACAHQAELAGGPVVGRFPVDYHNVFVCNSVLARRTRWPSGPVSRLEITQNLAISRRLFERLEIPLFNAEFGLTGGEDYDLFRRAERAGARQVWCDDAVIDELVIVDRLTTRSVFQRAFSSGISIIMVDRYYASRARLLADDLVGLAKSTAASLVRALSGRPEQAARDCLGVAYYAGRLAWQLGVRRELYR